MQVYLQYKSYQGQGKGIATSMDMRNEIFPETYSRCVSHVHKWNPNTLAKTTLRRRRQHLLVLQVPSIKTAVWYLLHKRIRNSWYCWYISIEVQRVCFSIKKKNDGTKCINAKDTKHCTSTICKKMEIELCSAFEYLQFQFERK